MKHQDDIPTPEHQPVQFRLTEHSARLRIESDDRNHSRKEPDKDAGNIQDIPSAQPDKDRVSDVCVNIIHAYNYSPYQPKRVVPMHQYPEHWIERKL